MGYARLVLLAAAAAGLLAFPASAQTIATMDGHYYKLVPLKGIPRYSSEVVTVIPGGATASVPEAKSLTEFELPGNPMGTIRIPCTMGHGLRSITAVRHVTNCQHSGRRTKLIGDALFVSNPKAELQRSARGCLSRGSAQLRRPRPR